MVAPLVANHLLATSILVMTAAGAVLLCCGVALWLVEVEGATVQQPLHVGAFNIQTFNKNKIRDEAKTKIIRQIISHYDLMLVQEIMPNAIDDMPILTRNISLEYGLNVSMALSPGLGRGSKEHLAYIYRMDRLKLEEVFVYPDEEDHFQRPPYVAIFSLPLYGKWAAIGVHTMPSNAAAEVDKLASVYDYVVKNYNVREAILMGDMNADCSAIPRDKWKDVSLWTRVEFVWVIGHGVDTTASKSKCAYDRFVLAGGNIKRGYVTGSGKVYNYMDDYGLTIEEARLISDHWPIEMKLGGKGAGSNVDAWECHRFQDNRDVGAYVINPSSFTQLGFTSWSCPCDTKGTQEFKYDFSSHTDLSDTLRRVQGVHPRLVRGDTVDTLLSALDRRPGGQLTIRCQDPSKDIRCTFTVCPE